MDKSLIQHIKTSFINQFSVQPILIGSPGRINIIGEHTDYNEGFVFPAAIDKGIVLAIQKSSSDFCAATALDVNETYTFSPDDIQPLSDGGWKNYVLGVVAEIQKMGKPFGNFNIVFGGNIPEGAGLSSSAALENAVVFALNSIFDLGLSKKEMIAISQKAEHNYVGVQCGIMDQYASMYGKKDTALFLDCRSLESTDFELNFKDYDIVLINTNVRHSLAESAYNERRAVCEKVAALLKIPALRDATQEDLNTLKEKISEEDYQKALYVIQENKRVIKAAKAIKDNDISALGALLYESHKGLQYQYKVSCPELDFLVHKAKENPSVIGARMIGGGFGGCTINLIKKEAVESYSDLIKKAFKKEFQKECSVYDVHLSQGTHKLYIP